MFVCKPVVCFLFLYRLSSRTDQIHQYLTPSHSISIRAASQHFSECLCRMIITISYYALLLNTSNLHGDPYLNCFLSAVTEVPAYIIALLLLKFCSRHLCQSSTLLLGGVMILCVRLIPIGKGRNVLGCVNEYMGLSQPIKLQSDSR